MNPNQIQGFVPKKEGFRKDADPFKPRANTNTYVSGSPFQPNSINRNMPIPTMTPVSVIVPGMPAQPTYPIPFADRSAASSFVPPKPSPSNVAPYSPPAATAVPPAPAKPAPAKPAPAAPKQVPAPTKPAAAAPVKPAAPVTKEQPAAKEQPMAKPVRPAPTPTTVAQKLNLTPQRHGSIAERRGSIAERHPVISDERLAELVRLRGRNDVQNQQYKDWKKVVFTPKALTEIWESVRDRMKSEIVEKQGGDTVNHFKWNISIVSVAMAGESDD